MKEKTHLDLNLFQKISNDGVYSIITDGEGEDYRITEGDYANDWEVIGIDKESMRVVVRKNGTTEVISPERSNSLSIISMSRSNNQESSDYEEATVDNIPAPNF